MPDQETEIVLEDEARIVERFAAPPRTVRPFSAGHGGCALMPARGAACARVACSPMPLSIEAIT